MRPALVLCVLAACYHDPAPSPVVVANHPVRSPRAPGAASDPLGYLPVDSEIVLSLDANRLRASGLWKMIKPRIEAKAGEVLEKFRTQCGVDLLLSIKQIAMSFKGFGEAPGPHGVFVVRGLDRTALTACMDRLVGTDPRVSFANGVVMVTAAPGENATAFTFASASTLVGVISPTASPEELAAVLKAGAPLRDSPMFLELLGQIQTKSTMWFAMNGNSKVFDKMPSLGFRPKAFTGSVDLANGFAGVARMRLDSADNARHLVGLGQPQLGQVKSMLDELELTSEDADVVLRVAMSQTQLESIVKALGAFAAGP
jgi:hypothetical protein